MERFEDRGRPAPVTRPAPLTRALPATHLAPVTYLPGVAAPAAPETAVPDTAVPGTSDRSTPATTPVVASPVARPTFASVYGANLADAGSAIAVPAPHHHDSHADSDAHAEPDRDRDGELHRAENVSMHALTRHGQSRRELERILRTRDLADDVVAHEVDRLERVGLIDDVALAQNLVGVLQERKGLGRSGISAELARRLLSPAAIEYALELIDTGDELGRAREIAIKRAGQLTSYDYTTAQRRLSAYLARRGFSGSTVRAAVDDALSSKSRHAPNGVRFR